MIGGSDEVKERIRQAIDIVDLVSEQMELRRQGRNFVGLCPWHADSRPSLQVNPDRQSWKCWVCDLGGDIFSFVMQREKVSFPEAIKMLADKAGIELETGPTVRTVPGSPDDKPTLYRAMSWACEQYHQCLLTGSVGAVGRDYLERRQINAESIARYRIGFVPNEWQWLLDRAGKAGFSPEVLQAVGLSLRSERTGKWLDRFRGRVMFPICDPQGRAIAIGGRILPEFADDKSAKYINSPETRLFSKSDQLYGFHLARDVVSRRREVIVMEGYTDVVIARQYGVDNAVAVLGTALGLRHLRLIRRFADRITLLLDGDQAGQRRAAEILELFLTQQVDLRIVTLPGNLDPCDFLLQEGADALAVRVAEAPDAWEYKIRQELDGVDPVRDTHRANRAVESLLSLLAKAGAHGTQDVTAHQLREQQILNRLAHEFRLSEDQLRARLKAIRQAARPPASDASAGPPTDMEVDFEPARPARTSKLSLEPVERELVEMMLQRPQGVPQVLESIHVTHLKSATARQIFLLFAELVEEAREASFQAVLSRVEDPALQSLLVELDEMGQKKQDMDLDLALRELLQTFSRRTTEEQLLRQQAELERAELDEKQELDMLLQLLRTRQELIDE